MSELDTPSELAFERSLYIGNFIAGVLYGIAIMVFYMSAYYLIKNKASNLEDPGAKRLHYIVYSIVLLSLWTISRSCNVAFGLLAWIDHRNAPGGPAAYLAEHQADSMNILGTSASLLGNLMVDSLLLRRCYIVWLSSSHCKTITTFLTILLLGTTAMAILTAYQSAQPDASFFRGKTLPFSIPYFSLTVSLNLILTILISSRIVYKRRNVRRVLQSETEIDPFISAAAMVVESGAPVTIFGLIFIIMYARNSSASFALLQIWGSFAPLSPLLIIMRVAMGKGWTLNTANRLSTVVFAHDSTSSATPTMTELDGQDRNMGSVKSDVVDIVHNRV